ncbi:MobV family relaxase [Calothrix sp. CCY 0018]|uniref:MobV family relaxase n=1 Tax=Calothrix sp. CCY 0018 TaxID=3103864 RepID=UPI0039C5BC2F
MIPLAVCKIQKIKGWGMLKGNEAHTARERDTPNANPEITNIRIIGDSSTVDLVTLVRDKIGSQKIRSNAVLAVEMLLSASASYFRPNVPHEAGTYEKQRLDNFVEASVDWLHSSWRERVVRAELHLDEITPHVHAYIVPLDEQGKLNCRALFGGKIKLSELQDSFGRAIEHLDISRGIKGSKATYTTLKKYYAAVNQDSQLINLERFLPETRVHETSEVYRQRIIQILNPEFEIINYQLNQRSRLLKQFNELKQTAIQSEKLRQKLESELRILKSTIERQELPLGLVAYELGKNLDNQWLSKTNAIDLVMRVNQCKFDDALIWLRDKFGEEQMLAAVTNQVARKAESIAHQYPTKVFVPPVPDKSLWKEVEKYFQNNYCIPQKLTQTLNQRGLLYADSNNNAVFLARNLSFEITGAYLHSLKTPTNAFSLYPGSKRSVGWFHLSMGRTSDNPITAAMLTASPIESLSLAILNTPHTNRTLYLSIDKIHSNSLPEQHIPIPVQLLNTIPNIAIAIPGKSAIAIQKLLPHSTKLQPKTTWNKELQQRQGVKNYATLE